MTFDGWMNEWTTAAYSTTKIYDYYHWFVENMPRRRQDATLDLFLELRNRTYFNSCV